MRGSGVTAARSCLQPLVSASRYLAVQALPGDPLYFVVEVSTLPMDFFLSNKILEKFTALHFAFSVVLHAVCCATAGRWNRGGECLHGREILDFIGTSRHRGVEGTAGFSNRGMRLVTSTAWACESGITDARESMRRIVCSIY